MERINGKKSTSRPTGRGAPNGVSQPVRTSPGGGRLPAPGAQQRPVEGGTSRGGKRGDLDRTLTAAREHLLALQTPGGYWCAELEGSPILQSEYILLLYLVGERDSARMHKLAGSLRTLQLESGGWPNFPGGPADVSTSVKAYFVLKLLGDGAEAPHMVRARGEILAMGGTAATNSFTRIYLSIFGQWHWSRCPAVPPEVILLPEVFPVNIYKMSSWSRSIVVPLSIVWAFRPVYEVPAAANIDELIASGKASKTAGELRWGKGTFWGRFFRLTDWILKAAEKLPLKPLRRKALERAEAWIVQRLEHSDGLGAIFPPIVNSIIAFRCLGYPPEHPHIQSLLHELERLEVDGGAEMKIQPCFSPVWDTANAMTALLDAGVSPKDRAMRKGARWLLEKEVRHSGDWQLWHIKDRPGGWYFEFANEFYPDADDTAEVLSVLSRMRFGRPWEEENRAAAIQRGLDWQLACQNADGGWPAFDKDCDNEVLTFVPFADHNAMIDPSCCDITGRTLLALRQLDFQRDSLGIGNAVSYLLQAQEPDGTWYGRWGCNYIYGTWLALRGLRAAGVDLAQERFQKLMSWFEAKQNRDGGWGESPHSYDDPECKGEGPSTASQTAWALMALLDLGAIGSTAVAAGLDYLTRTQLPGGGWEEDAWTGTGFPRVFYLKYHMYAGRIQFVIEYRPMAVNQRFTHFRSDQTPVIPRVGGLRSEQKCRPVLRFQIIL